MNQTPMKTLLHFMKPCRTKELLAMLFALISVAGAIIPYFCAYQIMNGFFRGSQTMAEIWKWSLIALIGFVVRAAGHAISTTIAHISAYTILESMRLYVADKLMKAPLGAVQSQSIGKLKNLLVDHVETIELPLAHVIPEGFAAFVLPLAVFVYLCSIDWRLALMSLVTIPIALIPFAASLKAFGKNYDNYMKTNDYVNGVIVEYVEGIEVVKAFNQSTSSYEKFSKAVHIFKETTLDWFKSTWTSRTLVWAMLPATLIGVLPLGMYLYMKEGLPPAKVAMCMLLSMGIVGCLGKFTTFINQVKSIQYALQVFNHSVNIPELADVVTSVPLDSYEIELADVSFSYGGDDGENVLKHISLKFPEGSFSALIGPSGSGKSTIARLISRFWDVTEGAIRIGGTDIRKMPLTQLADIVSFVTQDNFLFNTTIKENIRIGKPTATDEEVFAAAKQAQCDEFIHKLDHGYESLAGETGGKLSGGERQRIAIARAILKNAPIVILDEATAFTDPENEEKLQRSISELTKGKTLLVIAHRLSTIKNADNIIVLNRGEVEANGRHEHLLETCRLYHNMWKAHIGAKNWAATGKAKFAPTKEVV